MPQILSSTDLFAVVLSDDSVKANKVISKMRDDGVNIALGSKSKKLGDQIKIADKKGISHVLIIGEQELNSNLYTVKELSSGKEQKLSLKDITKKFSDSLENKN